jgi:hypothetical protein
MTDRTYTTRTGKTLTDADVGQLADKPPLSPTSQSREWEPPIPERSCKR